MPYFFSPIDVHAPMRVGALVVAPTCMGHRVALEHFAFLGCLMRCIEDSWHCTVGNGMAL